MISEDTVSWLRTLPNTSFVTELGWYLAEATDLPLTFEKTLRDRSRRTGKSRDEIIFAFSLDPNLANVLAEEHECATQAIALISERIDHITDEQHAAVPEDMLKLCEECVSKAGPYLKEEKRSEIVTRLAALRG